MCGILFSVVHSAYVHDVDDFIKDAFLTSQVRGTDSTGIFQLNRAGDMEYMKHPANASAFLETTEGKRLVGKASYSNLTVGHVRAATTGVVNKENAHPFLVERSDGTYLIGVHNGTLRNWRMHLGTKTYNVDSEWAFNHIAEHGVKAFEDIEGAYAFVWHDSREPDTVFMCRNAERPLHYVVTEGKKAMLGCSELGMLGWLVKRNKFNLAVAQGYDTAMYLEEGKLYKFSLSKIGSFETEDLPDVIPLPSTAMVTTRYNNVDDDYGDTEYGYGWMNHAHGTQYNYSTQASVINGVRKALEVAASNRELLGNRVNDDDNDGVIDGDDLDAALQRAIADLDSGPLESGPVDKPWFDDIDEGNIKLSTIGAKSASRKEIAEARRDGTFGQVVRFEPTMFDDEVSSLLGEYSVFEGGAWSKYDAEVRFCTTLTAQALIDAADDFLCAVVGIQYTSNGQRWMVVERLNKQQEDFVEQGNALASQAVS